MNFFFFMNHRRGWWENFDPFRRRRSRRLLLSLCFTFYFLVLKKALAALNYFSSICRLKNQMIRWWVSALHLTELFVSAVVHLLFGFYIFSTALAGDLSQAMNEWFSKPNVHVVVKEEETRETTSSSTTKTTTSVDDLPPIVLFHGIFGFGKGVIYFFLSWYIK